MSRETKSSLKLSGGVSIPLSEIETKAIQSQGPEGQKVNKVATAIQLSFDVSRSSLPEPAKRRLLNSKDHHLTREGVLIIRAQDHRSQEANRQTALRKLAEVLKSRLGLPRGAGGHSLPRLPRKNDSDPRRLDRELDRFAEGCEASSGSHLETNF